MRQDEEVGTVQLTKGIAQMSVATGVLSGDMTRSIVQIEAFSNMATGAYNALGPIGVGIAAIGAGYAANLQVQERALELSSGYWNQIIGDSNRAAQAYSRGLKNQFDVTDMKLRGTWSTAGSRTAVSDISFRDGAYLARRTIDDRSDLSPEQKAELRRRSDAQIDAQSGVNASNLRLFHLRDQLQVLDANRVDPEQARKRLRDTYGSQQRNIYQSRRELQDQIARRAGGDVAKLGSPMGEYGFLDPSNSQSSVGAGSTPTIHEQERLNDLEKQLAISKKEEAEKLTQLNEQLLSQARQEQSIQEEIARELANKHKTLSQIKEDAAATVRIEKEGIRAGGIAYGTSSEGDRLQEQELQKKHERIKQQLAARAVGGNVTVEEYSLHEMNLARSTGNIALETVEQQALEQAKKDGIQKRDFNQKTLAEAEQRKQVIDGFADPDMVALPQDAKTAADKSQEAAQRGMELITAIGAKTADSIEKLLTVMEQQQRQIEGIQAKIDAYRLLNHSR